MTQRVWRVLSRPKETAGGVVRGVESAFGRAVANPGLRDEARLIGINPVFKSNRSLGEFLEREHAFYLDKAEEWGILVDRSE